MTVTENCMVQRSDEWLKMRRSYIGASDAAVILGLSPYMTPYELWLEKLGLGEERQTTAAMQRGNDLESEALEKFNKEMSGFYKTGRSFEPTVRFHRTIPYMMASLDGFRPDLVDPEILEIKCNGKKLHDSLNGTNIPRHHYAQLQHQMEVCDSKEAYYMSYDGEKGVYFCVQRDEEFIQDMLKKEAAFWECVTNFVPPTMTERDRNRVNKNRSIDMKNNSEWACLCECYKFAQSKLEEAKEELEYLKNKMICSSEERNCHGSGLRLSKVEKKGFIDYDAIPELKGVELEKYRKPSTTYWKIENE